MTLENLQIPLMIIGNKSDLIDQINNEQLIDYMAYVLRKIATQHEAFLIYLSSKQGINLENFLSLLQFCILKKKLANEELLKPHFGIKNLVIPPGTDTLPFLSQKYKKILDFVVPKPD